MWNKLNTIPINQINIILINQDAHEVITFSAHRTCETFSYIKRSCENLLWVDSMLMIDVFIMHSMRYDEEVDGSITWTWINMALCALQNNENIMYIPFYSVWHYSNNLLLYVECLIYNDASRMCLIKFLFRLHVHIFMYRACY